MKVVYIAEDGTQFDDEIKCQEYEGDMEAEKLLQSNEFIMLNKSYTRTYNINNAFYLYFPEESGIDKYKRLCYLLNYDTCEDENDPFTPYTFYKFDEESDAWYDFETRVIKMNDELDTVVYSFQDLED